MHLLAYLFDPAEPELLAERELIRDDRVPRARSMVAKLRELGVPVTWEQVARIAGDGSVGRPHIASALVELGVVDTVSEAFGGDWLADGGRVYVPRHETDPFDAIRLVKAAGGVTVFAHPAAVKRGRTVPEAVIAELATAGLDGIEVDHMDHEPHDQGAAAGSRGRAGTARHGVQRLPRQPQDLRPRGVHDRPRGVRGDHPAGHRGVPGPGNRRSLIARPSEPSLGSGSPSHAPGAVRRVPRSARRNSLPQR